jgi:hypothetical protein
MPDGVTFVGEDAFGMPPDGGQKSAPPDEATLKAAFRAYYEVLKDKIAEYEIVIDCDTQYADEWMWAEDSFPITFGVYRAELLDFDNDGLPELAIRYKAPQDGGGSPVYTGCEVYGYTGNAELLFSGTDSIWYFCNTYFWLATDENGHKYFVDEHAHAMYGDTRYYTVKEGRGILVMETSFDHDDGVLTDETDENGGNYYINGEPVSRYIHDNVYNIELGIVWDDAIWEEADVEEIVQGESVDAFLARLKAGFAP